MKTYYECEGSVRGSCGHQHRTVHAAEACIDRDQGGCASQGGYSDRSLYLVRKDGTREIMVQIGSNGEWCTEAEAREMERADDRARLRRETELDARIASR